MTQADSVHSTPPTNTSEKPADISPEELSARLARQAKKRERALTRIRKLRVKARDEIDRLLEFLDASDVDPDLEPTMGFMNGPAEADECEPPMDDEPSLGWTEQEARRGKHAWSGFIDAEFDNCDDEPSLGSCDGPGQMPSGMGGQDYWARGTTDDREGCEHDGCEPDVDDEDGGDKEPMFGWNDEEAARGSYPSLMGARAEHEA